MTRSCSLQNLLADLGVNVILVTTLAKHCSYIYNLDSYCFKIDTLNSPRGGEKVFKGGHSPPPPLKITLIKYSIISSDVYSCGFPTYHCWLLINSDKPSCGEVTCFTVNATAVWVNANRSVIIILVM